MAPMLIYYGVANCVALAAALGLGYMGRNWYMAHFAAGFLGALSASLWIGVAMFYLIYAGQAVNRAAEAGLAAADDVLYHRLAKKKLFPWYLAAIATLIVGPFLGAIAQTKGGGGLAAHHAVSWISCGAYWLCVYLSREKITQTSRMIDKILADVEAIRKKKAAGAGGS
jgi:hypothetical protein